LSPGVVTGAVLLTELGNSRHRAACSSPPDHRT